MNKSILLILLAVAIGWSLPTLALAERKMTIRLLGAVAEGAPKRLTVDQIEEMPQMESLIYDPYLKKDIQYNGVCLTRFVETFASPKTTTVKISAIDEYVVSFDKKDLESEFYLLATRMDGKLMSRATSGPVKIVLKENDSDNLYVQKWIWMINRIEFLTD